jgi:hypothetical protein
LSCSGGWFFSASTNTWFKCYSVVFLPAGLPSNNASYSMCNFCDVRLFLLVRTGGHQHREKVSAY